jgi:hypothetical protein
VPGSPRRGRAKTLLRRGPPPRSNDEERGKPGGHERTATEEPRHAVDAGHLERLRHRQRREDGRHPPRDHRLPAAGRSHHQGVVAAGSRHLHRALERKVAAHLREVLLGIRRRRKHGRIDGWRGRLERAGEKARELVEALDADDVEAGDQRRLARVRTRADQPRAPCSAGSVGDRERSPQRPDRAIETELAADRKAREALRRDLATGGQERGRKCQVEPGARLAKVGGREVDRYPAERKLELGVHERSANPFARLLNRGVGKADDRERGQPRMDVDLDGHFDCVDATERERAYRGEHAGNLRTPGSRVAR